MLTHGTGSGTLAAMPRRARVVPGGFVYRVLNRTVARHALFIKDGDYEAFEEKREIRGRSSF